MNIRLRFAVMFVVAGTLSGCSVHLDLGPLDLPSLSTSEVARNNAAVCDSNISQAVTKLSLDGQAATFAKSQSRTRLDVFGPVWRGWSGKIPEGGGRPPSLPPAPTTPAALMKEAQRCVAQARVDSQVVSDVELARLLASAAAARSVEAARLAKELSIPTEPVTANPATALAYEREKKKYFSDTSEKPRLSAGVTQRRITTPPPGLVKALDQARYQLEWAAARSNDAIADDYMSIAHKLQAQIQSLVEAGVSDDREPTYPVAGPSTAQKTLAGVLAQELEVVGSSSEDIADDLPQLVGQIVAVQAKMGQAPAPFPGLKP
ncbi:MAG: hypothetical protein Q4A71_01950 [Actinomycetaceae bacterium]|nr:hypothetical protein [Actinomycetaceae bacterium]